MGTGNFTRRGQTVGSATLASTSPLALQCGLESFSLRRARPQDTRGTTVKGSRPRQSRHQFIPALK